MLGREIFTEITPGRVHRNLINEITPEPIERSNIIRRTRNTLLGTADGVLNQISPNNNQRTNYSTSPDELLIQLRGRRQIKLNLSPNPRRISSQNPLPQTPKKTNNGMALRSSPRKRHLINDLNVNDIDNNISADNDLNISPSLNIPMKRLKLEEKPIAQTLKDIPLNTILKGLSHDQLIDIINNILKRQPDLDEKIRAEIPLPDISPMEKELAAIKKNIYKSQPSSRLIQKTDSASYSKASIHLATFNKLIINQSRILYDSKNWDALLDYVLMSWNYVCATPVWDNNSQNALRRNCFKILACHCAAALKHGKKLLGQQRLIALERKFKTMLRDCDDLSNSSTLLKELLDEFKE